MTTSNSIYTESYESTLCRTQVRQARPIADGLLTRAQAKRQAAFDARDWDTYWFWFDYTADLAGLCGILNLKPLNEEVA